MQLATVILVVLLAAPLAVWLPWCSLVPAGALLALVAPGMVDTASVMFRRAP